MKISKKKIVAAAALMGGVALIAGGTLAYFTDQKTEKNVFTVGNVKITLYESQLHRENSGINSNIGADTISALASNPHICDYTTINNTKWDELEEVRYCTPNVRLKGSAKNISARKNGHIATTYLAFSDAQIKADAETYKDGYFADEANNMTPGAWVRKFAYVENTGKSDAYVRIRYSVPAEYADYIELKVPSTPYNDTYKYFTLVSDNSATRATTDDLVIEARLNEALKAGEMTYWSPVNTFRIKADVTTWDIDDSVETFVRVEADAIQANSFSTAADAFAAFDAQAARN